MIEASDLSIVDPDLNDGPMSLLRHAPSLPSPAVDTGNVERWFGGIDLHQLDTIPFGISSEMGCVCNLARLRVSLRGYLSHARQQLASETLLPGCKVLGGRLGILSLLSLVVDDLVKSRQSVDLFKRLAGR